VKISKYKILGGLSVLLISIYILFGASVCGRTLFDDVIREAGFGLEKLRNMDKSPKEKSTEFLWKTVSQEMHCSGAHSVDMKISLEELARRGDQNAGDILLDLGKKAKQQ
jgi:hypothetical protein